MSSTDPLQLWGGAECTTNRVGDVYHEQLDRSGHTTRLEDLDRFAELGIVALRQPVLWERTAPDSLEAADWRFVDAFLSRLRELRIRPIVGLVHHGSGPRHTSLLEPLFPEKLSQYAEAVAKRYPWVSDYTPVNEPLTTARFAALYGLWYPHARDDRSFVTALFNQCRGVALAMQVIRKVNPEARLVQTDDLGKIFSTPELSYQAEFENERRWLAFDLLCGVVERTHPMWSYLRSTGASERDIMWFAEHRCPPDILGLNHYLTSQRFLDHRTTLYPNVTPGGNGKDLYVDVEAVRVRAAGIEGIHELLKEAWDRFQRPLAITECHNGCTREEQMRWFWDTWRGAERARVNGIDVRAVTAWSLLGAFDWNTLVTRAHNHYEPGVFDIRSPKPRATALARLISECAAGCESHHPLVAAPGWWQRRDRFSQGFSVRDNGQVVRTHGPELVTQHAPVPPLLITGAGGTLGRAMARLCTVRGIPHRLLSRDQMDIADADSVQRALDHYQPWGIVNAAGYVRVDDAELDFARCHRENTQGPHVLAAACARRGIDLVTFSTDLVFDGSQTTPYVEHHPVSPLNVYGRTKAEAEKRVLDIYPKALVIRSSAFFGPWDEYNFVLIALRTIASGRAFHAAADATVSPTYVPDLVNTTLDLLIDGESGIWHLANAGESTWADLATQSAQLAGLDKTLIQPCRTGDLSLRAPRPVYSALGSARSTIMPPLNHALQRFLSECELRWDSPVDLAA